MIQVLHPGIYSSIQDRGRIGFSKFGVPQSGAMDLYSYQFGNSLLRNQKSSASIEITFGLAKFSFLKDAIICVTGANFSPRINNISVDMNAVLEIKKGSVLSFGKRKYGVRTYVSVLGGFQTEERLKSRSYYAGITEKTTLEKGDILLCPERKPHKNIGLSEFKSIEYLFFDEELTCYPGPEYDLLTSEQKEKLKAEFNVSGDNNRVGYRLEETLENDLKPILTSAVLPGTVQLTPSGKLIVLMRDCQVTGGYPRVLQLSSFAISQLSQKINGDKIQFLLKQ